jgi:cytoskeletal protein CcmA (bactofilin family)
MWRKPEKNKPQSALDALPSTVPSPRRPAAAAPVSSNAPACVTQGIKIKGEVSGREDLVLDGEFEGKIHIADGIFTVSLNARINAEIEAREIIVRGKVIGTLKARERVQVRSTGRVTGDRETRGIVIEDGAVLRGKVEVHQKDQPPQPPQPAVPAHAKEAVATASAQAKQQGQ